MVASVLHCFITKSHFGYFLVAARLHLESPRRSESPSLDCNNSQPVVKNSCDDAIFRQTSSVSLFGRSFYLKSIKQNKNSLNPVANRM